MSLSTPSEATSQRMALCILASAEQVLQKREEAKPRKQQTTHSVVASDLLQRLVEARAARAAEIERCQKLLKRLLKSMPTTEARDCLLAASVGCQVEMGAPVESGRCIFTGLTTNLATVCIFGDTLANGEPGRAESSFVINTKHSWRWWIEAVLVACNTTEWLDKQVAIWLDQSDVRSTLAHKGTQVTQATLDQAPHLLTHAAPQALALAIEFAKTHIV